MNTIYNKKRGGHLSLFNSACILFMLIQFIACTCGNDFSDDEGKARERVTTQTTRTTTQTTQTTRTTTQTTRITTQQKPTLTLTGPAEVKTGLNTITLDLEVTNGTLNTTDYSLKATDLHSYKTNNYTDPTILKENWTTVSGINGKTLQVLTGDAALNKGDKKTLSIPVTWVMTIYRDSPNKGKSVIYSESAEFQFAILDKAGNTVAGPIEVKWTCAP